MSCLVWVCFCHFWGGGGEKINASQFSTSLHQPWKQGHLMHMLPKGSQQIMKKKNSVLDSAMAKCCWFFFLKKVQAKISLQRIGLQIPTAKLDLDQAYQDCDAEISLAIGYDMLNTNFAVCYSIKSNLVLLYSFKSCVVLFCQMSIGLPQTEAVAWLPGRRSQQREPITAQFSDVLTCYLGFHMTWRQITVLCLHRNETK